MVEPATDVGTESTFTMLYIAVLESKGKDHWDQCCHTISRADVSPQALQLIPPNHANKVLVRMKDPLLNEWFAVCQVKTPQVVIGAPEQLHIYIGPYPYPECNMWSDTEDLWQSVAICCNQG